MIILRIAEYACAASSIITLCSLLVKPIRERLFGVADIKEGNKCLLRSEITRTYYRNRGTKTLREFEFKNVEYCYAAYKRLGGNSFIDRLHEEMQEWDIE